MVDPSGGPSRFAEDLRLAHVLADGVDSLAHERFRAQDLQISTKSDQTPVTDVDQTIEDALRSTLSRVRPRDAVLGEESGESGHGSRRWVIDPIDGTENFVRGVPVWAVLIALMDGEDVVVGLVAAPALQRRWWAAKHGGAWTGRSLTSATRCTVSTVSALGDAFMSYSSLTGWADRYRLENFLQLTRSVRRTRAYGDFWSYMLVAQGAVDIACEPEVSLWDLAAPSMIVTEAGGRFTDLSGSAGPTGGSAVATNGALHDGVLELLSRDLSDDEELLADKSTAEPDQQASTSFDLHDV
ncbi:MAG: histidinol phosphatase [Actinomycetota bacterium]|nr:histidinol phosphatase [Actinomycetota bacterium]